MTYYFNDTLVNITGISDNAPTPYLNVFGGNIYYLEGQDSVKKNNVSNNVKIIFQHDSLIQNTVFAVPDSLQARTYNFSLDSNSSESSITFVRYDGSTRMFEILKPSDHFTFTITRYSNGTIDGRFFGTLSEHGLPQSVSEGQIAIITNGQFSNIPVKK